MCRRAGVVRWARVVRLSEGSWYKYGRKDEDGKVGRRTWVSMSKGMGGNASESAWLARWAEGRGWQDGWKGEYGVGGGTGEMGRQRVKGYYGTGFSVASIFVCRLDMVNSQFDLFQI